LTPVREGGRNPFESVYTPAEVSSPIMGAVTGFGKEFKCEICGAMFENVEQLMAHLREHSSGMPSGAND
jgi:hypothetical protein